MDTSKLQSYENVQDVLRKWPQAMSVFMSHKTACVGCYLARFCTLEEVATTHKFALDSFLKNLNEVIQSNQRSNTNENL